MSSNIYQLLAEILGIIWIDIVLSSDNALVIGMAAATLAPHLRRRAIFWGMAMAVVFRILAAFAATYLYHIPWVRFLGGLALLWVAWKLYQGTREAQMAHQEQQPGAANAAAALGAATDRQSIQKALLTICIADVSMSVDNILAVAAIAQDDRLLLVFGLALSIMLMAFFATAICRLLARHIWIGYVGIVVLILVAGEMLHSSWNDVLALLTQGEQL